MWEEVFVFYVVNYEYVVMILCKGYLFLLYCVLIVVLEYLCGIYVSNEEWKLYILLVFVKEDIFGFINFEL